MVRQIFLIDVNGIMFFLGHMCNRPLGMMTGAIKNSAITASSMWDKHHAPFWPGLMHDAWADIRVPGQPGKET